MIASSRFPRGHAATIAIRTILNWFAEHPLRAFMIDEIKLVVFKKEDEKLYKDYLFAVSIYYVLFLSICSD